MYEINLVKTEKRKNKPRIIAAAIWTILFAVPLGAAAYVGAELWSTRWQIKVAQTQLDQVERDLQTWADEIEFINQSNSDILSSNAYLRELSAYLDQNLHWTPMLTEMVQMLPKNMRMDDLYVSRNSEFVKTKNKDLITGKNEHERITRSLQACVVYPGRADGDQDIRTYIERLRVSEHLGRSVKDIRMNSLRESQGDGIDWSRYDLECLIESGEQNEQI